MGWREVWVREARRRAVEAAAKAAWGVYWPSLLPRQEATARNDMENAITAYERAMADAGWRMVRVPDAEPMHGAVSLSSPEWLKVFGKTRDAWANGWNACRAKMLEDEG